MNKLSCILFIALFSFATEAAEYGKWIPAAKYTHVEEYSPALEVAKKWALEKYNPEKDKISFEFRIRPAKEGYEVTVDNLYHTESGEFAVAVDGEMCLYLDKNFKLKRVKQCMAP
ncbi:hypothetical protein ACUR5C_09735 [Aliikangiella sp. IMCC44653]